MAGFKRAENTAYKIARELNLPVPNGLGYVTWEALADLAYLAYWENRIVRPVESVPAA